MPRRRTPTLRNPPDDPRAEIGRRLRELRVAAGLSQAQLGAPHYTRAHVSALEKGKIRPSLATLLHMARHLGVGLSTLVPDDLGPASAPDFSGMSVRQLRAAHESAVAEDTARILRAHGLRVRDLRRGVPEKREPDAVFTSQGRMLGIEMSCVGYFERGTQEAGEYLRRSWEDLQELLRPDGPTMVMGPPLMNFDDVKDYAQSLLDQKCAKTYNLPTILVICAVVGHVGLTTAEQGPTIVRELRAPEGCPFERIYLRMQRNISGDIELLPLV